MQQVSHQWALRSGAMPDKGPIATAGPWHIMAWAWKASLLAASTSIIEERRCWTPIPYDSSRELTNLGHGGSNARLPAATVLSFFGVFFLVSRFRWLRNIPMTAWHRLLLALPASKEKNWHK